MSKIKVECSVERSVLATGKKLELLIEEHFNKHFNFKSHVPVLSNFVLGSIPEPKTKFIPKTKYHLYDENGDIQIYGFSQRDIQELAKFFDRYASLNGFWVRNSIGEYTGFINKNLLCKLSLHIQKVK